MQVYDPVRKTELWIPALLTAAQVPAHPSVQLHVPPSLPHRRPARTLEELRLKGSPPLWVQGPALIVAWTSVRLLAIEYAPRWWELKDVPKAQLDSTQPSLTEVFKLRPGEWQCGSCMTRNTARAVKQCASCSANKCAASAASRQ